MTARPQDVALLPLPRWLRHPEDKDVAEAMQRYARANVTAALASAQAREDELRAEGVRIERENREGWKQAAHWRGRAERLEEALREARASADAARTGYSGQHASGTFRRMVQKIDAALSTNAATQTGETT